MSADEWVAAAPDDGRRVPLRPDAVPLAGQLMSLPPGRYDWLYLRIDQTAPQPGAETVWLHYADAVDPETLPLPAGRGTHRVPVTRRAVLTGVRLPDVPTARILAATLVTSASEAPR
ncbi:hypothetical protein [Micromonospora yangpuensis]|uniref:Uncharacterized protein n=1 Tax=Micromonospora yangpuensis TaxID=683228 RepID=A0A1C6VH22_9ACTN|nr:hypothetical protein [Micromonospora yangpuensis]GGL99387.1 hypothetical protein GCM10012279_15950 [Micromonospora yangpuensis]SCL65595.1 hypothetical protein GA0070617_5812 [Micromonospora yangpuensis]